MRFKMKVLILIALVMIANPAFAGIWDWGSIPVPDGTEEVNKETRRYAGSNFDFIYYLSAKDADGIRDFYRSRLSTLGWKESDMRKNLNKVPGFDSNPGFSEFFDNNLLFEKEGELITLCILPARASKDGKTRYSLQKGKLDPNSLNAVDKPIVAELVAKPRKEILVYPGASLLNLSEGDGSSKSTYMSTADIETVMAYYKEKMADKGWTLDEEQPISKKDVQNNSQEILKKNCPTCTEHAVGATKVESLSGELLFSNQDQAQCHIVLSAINFPGIPIAGLNNTVIMVKYEEKKK